MRELRRVLRPGGRLQFVEHGRSPSVRMARWQDRLDPLTSRILGGCHTNRPVASLLQRAGLDVERLDTYYLPHAPRPFAYFYEGVATTVER